MDCAMAVILKTSTSYRTPNTIQNYSKLIDLAMRIELTQGILMPRFSNFPRNTNINFRMCLYLVTCFLTVAISLLWRSKKSNNLVSLHKLLDRDKLEHVSLIPLLTGRVTKP